MPRQARIDFPGALHHVIGRSIEKKHIFAESKDKNNFYSRLSTLLNICSIQCYAWCIMDNHFHLLLITGKTSLAEFMRRLLTGYAIYYNKIHKRVGHLFQNRYKSILCDSDEYLLPLIRYIHLNPVRAKIVPIEKLDRYPWSGHGELLFNKNKKKLINRDEVFGYFGRTEKAACESYIHYVNDGVGLKENYSRGGLIQSAGGLTEVMSRKKDEYEMFDARILGEGSFVESVYQQMDIYEKKKDTVGDMQELVKKVGEYYGVNYDDILYKKDKSVRDGRSVAIYLTYKYLQKTLTEIGKVFGIKQSAATSAMQRGKTIIDRDSLESIIMK